VVSVAINRGCEDNIVEDNTIHSSITAFTGPIITQDFAPRRSYGIRMTSRDWEATENNTLHNNTINGSDYCILLNASEDGSIDFNDIEGNNLTNCTFGIYINVASGNSFQSNWVCGSDDTDIYVESKSGTDTGDGNTCQTVRGWSDLTAGPTGCTNWCSPVEVEPEEEEEKDKKTRGSGSYYMTGTTLAPPLPPPPQEEEPPAQPPAEPKLELQIVGTPEAGGEITIIVTDQDGNPVPGAEVTVDGETYTTDEDGRVTVELGEAGVLAIDASLPGYEGTQLNIQVKEAPEEPSAAGQAEQPKPRAEPPADYTLPIIVLVVIIGGVLMYIFFLRR